MRRIALLLALPAVSYGQGGTPSEIAEMLEQNKEQLTWAINALSRCAAVYEIAAKMNDLDKPATAETWRGTSRGAEAAAMYLLGMENAMRGGEPKPYGEFAPYVDAIAETSTAHLLALLENGDTESFQLEFETCISLMELQTELIQEMRDEAVGR